MKLYGLKCGIGYYYVVATDPTDAERMLLKTLNDADYGYSSHREVSQIDVIAEAPTDRYLTGKFLII